MRKQCQPEAWLLHNSQWPEELMLVVRDHSRQALAAAAAAPVGAAPAAAAVAPAEKAFLAAWPAPWPAVQKQLAT
jgi:hypothetical protein